jgi:hypothetical protein
MKPTVLAATIGGDMRFFRETHRLRQDDVARAARKAGLPWTRSMVVSLEAGRRDLSIDEFVRLPQMLERLGVGTVDVQLLASTTGVRLRIAHLHHEQDLGAAWAGSVDESVRVDRALEAAFFWTHGRAELAPAYEAAGGDLEQKIARRVGLDPLVVALIAQATWGRSLTEERDRRVAAEAPGAAPPRAVQALRGHVTRALLQQLEPRLTEARRRLRRAEARPRRHRKGGRR